MDSEVRTARLVGRVVLGSQGRRAAFLYMSSAHDCASSFPWEDLMPISAATARRAIACTDASDALEEIASELRGKLRPCDGFSDSVAIDWEATSENQMRARVNLGIYAAVRALTAEAAKLLREEDDARRAPCPLCVQPQRKHCPACGACVDRNLARVWTDDLAEALEQRCAEGHPCDPARPVTLASTGG